MSAKFTPGPWSKRAIAAALRAAHKHDGGWIDELGDGENMPDEDDAHLIAAAPKDREDGMSSELKPCPHCGSTRVALQARHPRISPYFVECRTCDARGARSEDREEAIAFWNLRPIEDALRDRIDALEWLRECVDLEQDRRDKTRSSLTWWENMWKKAEADFADEDEEYAYLGHEWAKERMDSLKAEFLATFEAARRAVEPKTMPRCPDCGQRLDTEECGCGGDA